MLGFFSVLNVYCIHVDDDLLVTCDDVIVTIIRTENQREEHQREGKDEIIGSKHIF